MNLWEVFLFQRCGKTQCELVCFFPLMTNMPSCTPPSAETDPATSSVSEEEDSWSSDSEDNPIIRCKWMGDGCKTLEELALALEDNARHMRELATKGWELKDAISDDYGFLTQRRTIPASSLKR